LFQAPLVADATWALAVAALVWRADAGWRPDSVAAYGLRLQCGDAVRALRVRPDAQGQVSVWLDDTLSEIRIHHWADGVLRYTQNGVQSSAIAVRSGSRNGGAGGASVLHLALDGHSPVFHEVSAFPAAQNLQDASRALAPVAGTVAHVLVAMGDTVQPGQRLLCVEAMKMEMWLCAQAAGTVRAVHARVGDQVATGALLVELELAATETAKE
jgi:geranyl-CoA carboxylase alpha subunit